MRAPQERGLVPEQSANGSAPLDVVRQVVREEIAPLARDVTELREDVTGLRGEFAHLRGEFTELREEVRGDITGLRGEFAQLRRDVALLAEGQKVLLEDMAEVKQVVRGHEARITALERDRL